MSGRDAGNRDNIDNLIRRPQTLVARSGSTRLIWLGFDGASMGFVERFAAEGRLPTISRLMAEGAWTESLPVPPCDTPTNWAALQTGAHPGTTEVVSFFTHHPGDPLNVAKSNMNSLAVKAETVWEAAERQGREVILLNWPCSWPSRLERGVQVNGTGPFTASWRLSFGRLYHRGDLDTRQMDPAVTKLIGSLAEAIELRPAHGWASEPASNRPPLMGELAGLGTEEFRWSETGMQILGQGKTVETRKYRYHVLVVASGDDGYDRVIVSRSKSMDDPVADLRVGDWSPFIREQYPREMLLDDLVPAPGDVTGVFRFKLIRLSGDARTLVLYRTDIWQADGWAHPREMAREINEAIGPFTEGLELPPPPSRVLDEWETYRDQLDQAREWYVAAARHLTTTRPWDILALQLHLQDGINHVLARDICEEDPAYTPAKAAAAWKQFEHTYVTLDRLVGEVIDACADNDTVVCVVSDHGAMPTLRQCLVSNALTRAGLMTYVQDPGTGRYNLDWSKTKVFPRRGHLWVNLKGRDPDGIVAASDYEQVRTIAIRALLSIYDEERGTQPVTVAVRKEDAVNYGLWGESVGDVITFMAPLYADSDVDYASVPYDPSTTPDVGPTDLGCAHHPYLPSARYGIWGIPAITFLAGPGVRRGYQRGHPISQVDVAPTLCHLIGIEAPADCEGKVVADLLEPKHGHTSS